MKTFLSAILIFTFTLSFAQNEKTLQFVSITNDIDTCENLPIKLIVEFVDYDSLQWERNNGTGYISLSDDATYSGTNNDTLLFTTSMLLDNSQFRCVGYNLGDSILSDALIINIENVYPRILQNNMSICYGDTLHIDCIGNIVSCNWSTGETSSAIDVYPSDTTTYYANMINIYGCSSYDSVEIGVINLNSNFTIEEDTLCRHDYIIATAEIQNYNEIHYYWKYNNNNTYFESKAYIINNSLNLVDTLFFNMQVNYCFSDTSYKLITNLYNNAEIIKQNDTLYASQGDSYQWYRNEEMLVNETDSFLVLDSTGLYTVEVTAINGCSKSANYYYFNANTFSQSQIDICEGDSIYLVDDTCNCLLIDFNNLTLSSYLDNNFFYIIDTIRCMSSDNTPYFWASQPIVPFKNYCIPRSLTTKSLDLTEQDYICFDFKMGCALLGSQSLYGGLIILVKELLCSILLMTRILGKILHIFVLMDINILITTG